MPEMEDTDIDSNPSGPDADPSVEGENPSASEKVDDQGGQEEETAAPEKRAFTAGLLGAFFRFKWILISFLLTMVLVIMGIIWVPLLLEKQDRPEDVPPGSAGPGNRTVKRDMRTFFIPLPPDSKKQVARIELSLISDRLAYIRYTDRELEIRDTLYKHLSEWVQKERESLKIRKLQFESTMTDLMNRTLGTKDIKVKLKNMDFV